MQITLRLYGNLRRYAKDRRETAEMNLAEGTTIQLLLDSLHVPETAWWLAAVNDQVVAADTALRENDVVEVFEPVGGGS